MSLDRRAFLGSLAGTCLSLAGVARADGLKEFNRRRIDRNTEYFGRPVDESGYLDQPAFVIDDCPPRGPQTPYQPQAGDIVFSISNYWIFRAGHKFAGAGEPSHSAIVWRNPDGAFAILEAGPFDVPLIRSLDMVTHLGAYHERGRVWIRPRATPLTEEQTCRLAEFAMKQENKPFARFRLCAQITPCRSRGPLRTYVMGQSHGPDRVSYFCAELVTEALVYAGTHAAEDTRPAATYPHDLFFDDSTIPFLKEHFHLSPCWAPPSRWRPCITKS